MDLHSNQCATGVYEVPCFDLLTADERTLLDEHSVLLQYHKGETIAKQGSFAAHILYLEKGLVKVYLEGNAKNLILNITPEGHLLGLQSLFEGNQYFVYSVSTYTDATVRMIDVATFSRLLRQNATFTHRILNIVNESSAQAYARFFTLTQKQLHGRLADILLCLSAKIFNSDTFELPLSRNDLGELSSMSTESVIRIMKDFKDDGLIDMHTRKIRLLDIPRLAMISRNG